MIKNYLTKKSCRQRNVLKASRQWRWVSPLGQMASQQNPIKFFWNDVSTAALTCISEFVFFQRPPLHFTTKGFHNLVSEEKQTSAVFKELETYKSIENSSKLTFEVLGYLLQFLILHLYD